MLKSLTNILEKVDSQAERALRGTDAAENAESATPKESDPTTQSPRILGSQDDLVARNTALEAQIRDQYRELKETRQLLAETRKQILSSDPAKLESLEKEKRKLQKEVDALRQQMDEEKKTHASNLAEVQKELESTKTLHEGNKMELHTVKQVHQSRADELSMENARLLNELSEVKTKLADAEAHQALLMLRIQGTMDESDLNTLRDPVVQAAVKAATEQTRRECAAISENEMATMHANYQKEIQTLKASLSEANRSADTLKRVLKERESQLEAVESKHTQLATEFEAAKRQLRSLGHVLQPAGSMDPFAPGAPNDPAAAGVHAGSVRELTQQLMQARETENRLLSQMNGLQSSLRLERQRVENLEMENAELHKELQQLKKLWRNTNPGYMLADLEKGLHAMDVTDEIDPDGSRPRVFDLGSARHVQRLFYPLAKRFHTRYEAVRVVLHQLDMAYEGLFRGLVNPYVRIGAVLYLVLIHIWSLMYLFFHTHSIKSGGHSHSK